MNRNEIHEIVENAITNNDETLFASSYEFESERDEYVYNTGKRLVKIWCAYQIDVLKKVDFECTLRNYLLLIKKEITIQNYEPSDCFESFGLQINKNTGKIWTSLLLPDFTNNVLVKQLFMQDLAFDNSKSSYNLYTNAFIKEIGRAHV